jgi:hypothetical protein
VSVYTEREEPLNQGDVFRELGFSIPRGDDRSIEVLDGMVISHHCDCDKFHVEQEKGDAHDMPRRGESGAFFISRRRGSERSEW